MSTARRIGSILLATAWLLAGCGADSRPTAPAGDGSTRPSILLVTLDTTRADAIGPGAAGVETPAFDALARRGQALPAGVRDRARDAALARVDADGPLRGRATASTRTHAPCPASTPLLAERLQQAGYRTAAFVSSVVLARRFGLARGFDVYDDELPAGQVERSARRRPRVRRHSWPRRRPSRCFVWVHYYDPHHPYSPPEPFRGRYAKNAVPRRDRGDGRAARAAGRRRSSGARGDPRRSSWSGDHGEGLGEHGESQHGKLLYQATMHVPLVVVGPGVTPGVSDAPVSTRRVFHTILDWAGLADASAACASRRTRSSWARA